MSADEILEPLELQKLVDVVCALDVERGLVLDGLGLDEDKMKRWDVLADAWRADLQQFTNEAAGGDPTHLRGWFAAVLSMREGGPAAQIDAVRVIAARVEERLKAMAEQRERPHEPAPRPEPPPRDPTSLKTPETFPTVPFFGVVVIGMAAVLVILATIQAIALRH